jgi:uncharacterized membrane protein YidH (DUF202 family)
VSERSQGPPDPEGAGPDPDEADRGDRDPGLQPERTSLAWRRTVLAMGAVAILAARFALTGRPAGLALAAVALAGWLAIATGTTSRTMAARRGRPATAVGGLALPLTALGAIGYAVLGLVLVLVGAR